MNYFCQINQFRKSLINLLLKRHVSSVEKSKWQSVVGLEVHAQIDSASKLFSGASTEFSSPVNSNVSLFDCSIPGTLPVLNKKCVEHGVLTSLALNCHVNPVSLFDRKHYFYGDIPAGYQITQQRSPLATSGRLDFQVFTPGIHKKPYTQSVRIKQLQLEQDSGKSLHDFDRSLVDLNRAGAPLMEIVFEPDLVDGEEAAALVKELVAILLKIKTCNCRMEEGALRVDANVSIHKKGEPLGTRTEIKNIGSIRGVANAIRFEIDRQIKIKNAGGVISNETRAWDAANKATVSMRDKEEQQDYRYMPEPNLPPLHLAIGPVKQGDVSVDEIRKTIPELPEETRTRLRETLGLSLEQSLILVNENRLLKLFEEALADKELDGKLLANLIINEFITLINKKDLDLEQVECNSRHLAEIVALLQEGVISRNTAKILLSEIIDGTTKSPRVIVNERNLKQIINAAELEKLISDILKENDDLVDQYKSGKTKVFKAFLGKVASKSQQRADMAKSTEILRKLLK